MDCVNEDAFRERVRDVGQDTEWLSRRDNQCIFSYILVYSPRYYGEVLTFMPAILADVVLLEREVKVGGSSRYVSEDHSLITRRTIGCCVCTSPCLLASC